MKFQLVCFGKVKSNLKAEYQDFVKRFPKGMFETIELKESNQNSAEVKLSDEMKVFEKKVPNPGFLVLLDERGKCPTSVELSKQIFEKWTVSNQTITFLIGSSYGVHKELKAKANYSWALTPLTLTHDHARLIFIEQLYRARCIEQGHPYHHA